MSMIKPFIISALTTDGFIAKDTNHAAYWTSKEDKARFVEITKRAGVVVMGQTTFKTLKKPLPGRLNIVYSLNETFDGAETTTDEPAVLFKKLEERGFKEVAICGGQSIYTMFMKSGLIEKLYLTVEPVVFGKGLTIFNQDIDFKLELVSEEKTPSGTLLLEYKVLK